MSRAETNHMAPLSFTLASPVLFLVRSLSFESTHMLRPSVVRGDDSGLCDCIHLPKKQSLAAVLKDNPAAIIKIEGKKMNP